MKRRLAVCGAGIQGASIALELAYRGHRVDLYEKDAIALGRASSSNEGKLHLGLVYGNDPGQRTARLVMRGSLRFAPIVGRWMPFAREVPVSEPFYYLQHRDSIVDEDRLAAHFEQVAAIYREESAAPGTRYFDGLHATEVCARLAQRERVAMFDSPSVRAAWRSGERSVDSRAVAQCYREALVAEPKIRTFFEHPVKRASALEDGRIALEIEHAGAQGTEVYDRVANACWEGLLALDASFGARPERAWLHRFKLGSWVALKDGAPSVPSVTVVLGPFGDVSNFGRRELYVSWYPACMIASSSALVPPDWRETLDEATREMACTRSLAALGELVPALAGLAPGDIESVDTRGGVIFAWGETGIEDRASELHTRHAIGVRSWGNYHSVNTGRFCTAPMFALETCDRMLGNR